MSSLPYEKKKKDYSIIQGKQQLPQNDEYEHNVMMMMVNNPTNVQDYEEEKEDLHHWNHNSDMMQQQQQQHHGYLSCSRWMLFFVVALAIIFMFVIISVQRQDQGCDNNNNNNNNNNKASMPLYSKNKDGGGIHTKKEDMEKMKLITGASLPSNPKFFTTENNNHDDKKEKTSSMKTINIVSFGADPTGLYDSTMAIQDAIDSLSLNNKEEKDGSDGSKEIKAEVGGGGGGGIVLIPKGRYRIKPIQLRSNVFLSLDEHAVLMASGNREDYVPDNKGGERRRKLEQDPGTFPLPLIQCTNQVNTGILGSISSPTTFTKNDHDATYGTISNKGGVISGQASTTLFHYYDHSDDRIVPITWDGGGDSSSSPSSSNDYCPKGNECRPRLLEFHNCSSVRIENVMLRDSMDWTLHILGCENVLVQGLIIRGDFSFPNNDGIDITSSTNVTILNNNIDTADDAICIKSTSTHGHVNNILIANNTVRSHSSAFKIGSSTEGNISNVAIDGLYILHANRGLGIQHRDEGHVQNIFFNNVYMDVVAIHSLGWWGCGEPIWITSTPRANHHHQDNDNSSSSPSYVGAAIGTVSNISFSNIVIRRAENTILISSRGSDMPVSNISFRNITMRTGLVGVGNNGGVSVGGDISSSSLSRLDGVTYKMPGFEYVPSYSPQNRTCSIFGGDAPCDAIHLENVKDVIVDHAEIWWGEEEERECSMMASSTTKESVAWGECVGVSGTLSGNVFVSKDVVCHSSS